MWINHKAVLHNSVPSGTENVTLKPFLVTEMMQHMGLYILHNISHSP